MRRYQKYYYDIHGIEYELYAVVKDNHSYKLMQHNKQFDKAKKDKLKNKIRIYEGEFK